MTDKNVKELSIEELVRKVKKNKSDKESFNELFTRCSKLLLAFLIKKNFSYEDSEDLLQEYFISDFDKAIEKYKETYNKKFINYIKRILILRAISYTQSKKNPEINHLESFYNEHDFQKEVNNFENFNTYNIDTKPLKSELREFFKEVIYKIENENHRNALLFMICVPFNIGEKEAAELFDIKVSTFGTWIRRGVLDLKRIVQEENEKYNFDFNSLISLLKNETFFIDKQTINEIENQEIKNILIELINKRKSFKSLKKTYEFDNEIKKKLFNYFCKIFNKQENFYRFEDNMQEKENSSIYEYFHNLDVDGENLRSLKTTGDEFVDKLLLLMKISFKENLSVAEKFKEKILSENRSVKEIAEELSLNIFEINEILAENTSLDESILKKITDYIRDYKSAKTETNPTSEQEILRNDEFNQKADEISLRLRKHYEENKNK